MDEIIKLLVKFRNDRNWEQFHNSKDLALALSIEAAELNELFLWKKAEDADIEKLQEELADVFIYALLLVNKYNFNLNEIILKKIEMNGKKYPIEKVKGCSKKYKDY